MKKHNILKVVLITLLVFLVLSWIFPAAYFSGEYVDQGRVQMGLSELFNYFMTSLSYFGHYALYVILVGSFYGILYKIPAYRTFLDKVVSSFKGKEKLYIILTVVLLALGVSISGLQVGFIFLIPLIVSIILLMGYDKVVAAMTIVGSIAAGLIGSTYAYGNLSILTSLLSLDLDYQIGVRFVILLVCVVLVIFNIFMYTKNNKPKVVVESTSKNKKEVTHEEVIVEEEIIEEKKTSPKKSNGKKTSSKSSNNKSKSSSSKKSSKNANKAALREEDIIIVKESVTGDSNDDDYLVPTRVEVTHKIWPFVIGFILMFVLLVLSFTSWSSSFGVTLFDDVTTNVTEFELFGFPIFSKVYGSVGAFGNWSVIDLFLPTTLLLILLTIIYRVKFNDILDGAINGAKKALIPAFIVLIAYTMLVAVTYHPFQMSIYKAILGLTKGFNIATTVIVSLLATIFNVDPMYTFQSFLPYYTSIVSSGDNYAIAGIISQAMYGFGVLFAPSSFILMTILSYLKINYGSWLKNTWKLLVELFVVLLIVFIVLTLI